MDIYISIALTVLVLYGVYKFIESRRAKKKGRDAAPPMSDPLPPEEALNRKDV